ncbi:MAG: hypothetical protein RLZZ387_5424 [Chloroflexota bacterium]|jgi:hypothetical protein
MTTENDSTDHLVFNGVDVERGDYLLPPLTPHDVAGIAEGKPLDPERLDALRRRREQSNQGQVLGVMAGIRPDVLAEAGWGVVFPRFVDALPLIDALRPLLDLRREQVGHGSRRFQVYHQHEGARKDQRAAEWVAERGGGPGPVDPDRVPYYLLIVASPEEIPFEFQYDLDIQHAVGRLHFDTLDEYASYARSVVAAEKGEVLLPRRLTFFGVENLDDQATRLSARDLVGRLAADIVSDRVALPDMAGWDVRSVLRDEASKDRLAALLGGAETPGLLFTASHGAGFSEFDTTVRKERQRRHQGALICKEWPGPRVRQPLSEQMYFSGDDLGAGANVLGTVAFMFACFGAGTPRLDDFAHKKGVTAAPEPIAPAPFIARLPQRLLGHPRGGALAVVGHVERATGYSFSWPESGEQTPVFRSALRQLLRGERVGVALEDFNERFAELGTLLSAEQTRRLRNQASDDMYLARIWTASNDARSYIVFGDPAVRLAVSPSGETKQATPSAGLATTPVAVRPAQPASSPAAPAEFSAPPSIEATSLRPEVQVSTTENGGGVSVQVNVTLPGGTAPAPSPDVEFGIFGGDKDDDREGLRQSLRAFGEDLTKRLGQFLDNVTTLEVTTYVSGDLAAVKPAPEGSPAPLTNVTPRALTRIKFDGDTLVVVPQADGELDEALWRVHTDMVRQAQATRAEMMRLVLDIISGPLSLGR